MSKRNRPMMYPPGEYERVCSTRLDGIHRILEENESEKIAALEEKLAEVEEKLAGVQAEKDALLRVHP